MVYTSSLTLLPFPPQHLPPFNPVSSLLVTVVMSAPPHYIVSFTGVGIFDSVI